MIDPIRHYGPWNIMKLNHFPEVQIGYAGGIVGLVVWNKASHLEKAINHYKVGILIPFSPWQANDEIHANIFPWET